jgi:hypothetical protein
LRRATPSSLPSFLCTTTIPSPPPASNRCTPTPQRVPHAPSGLSGFVRVEWGRCVARRCAETRQVRFAVHYSARDRILPSFSRSWNSRRHPIDWSYVVCRDSMPPNLDIYATAHATECGSPIPLSVVVRWHIGLSTLHQSRTRPHSRSQPPFLSQPRANNPAQRPLPFKRVDRTRDLAHKRRNIAHPHPHPHPHLLLARRPVPTRSSLGPPQDPPVASTAGPGGPCEGCCSYRGVESVGRSWRARWSLGALGLWFLAAAHTESSRIRLTPISPDSAHWNAPSAATSTGEESPTRSSQSNIATGRVYFGDPGMVRTS